MIKILAYDQIDQQQWKELIEASATATWFQTPEAYQFYASVSEMIPFAVGVVEASPKSSPKGKDFQSTPNPSLNEPTSNSSLKGREYNSFAKVFGAHTADSMQYDLLKKNAIENRKNPTEAESVLWDMLKGNKLGAHFRRQHIILDYLVDFICLDKGLIIELDGGYHNDPRQKEYDKARTAHLQRLGYTELRFANEELLCNPDAVIQKITDTLEILPSLQGRAGDRLVGVIVGYITRERNPLKQYFTCRSIIIGGPLLDEHISDEALSALLGAVAQCPASLLIASSPHRLTKPIYIESRNFHDYSKWRNIFEQCGFQYQPHLNFHVDTTKPWETIENNIGKHRRKYIRLSYRDGVEVELKPTLQQVKEYYAVLQDLYRTKVKMPLQPWSFFERLYHMPSCKYLLVMYNNQVVGGSICMTLKNHGVYEWYACGKDGMFRNIHPSSVTKYVGMKYASDNGYKVFDMMGAGKPNEAYGVRDFKAEFGGTLVEHGRFLCVRKPLLYWIGKIGVKLLKK